MRDAVAVNPNYADVYLSLGELYADHIKDQPKAVEAFRRYLDLGGNNARARAAVEKATPSTP
jgi:Tfp pilus assembly protein PilF